jgi:hypothetical protein
MQDALRTLVGGIRMSVESIGVASAGVAMGNQDLSARTEQAASSLQQTASSVEQIASTVRQSADSAKQADQLARPSADDAPTRVACPVNRPLPTSTSCASARVFHEQSEEAQQEKLRTCS